jgi:TonB family protein
MLPVRVKKMSLRRFGNLMTILVVALLFALPVMAQERKAKEKIAPAYPEMAKSMHLAGMVKVQITITQQGAVKDAKVVGGHPLLADAAMRAISKWKYEAGPEETQIVQFEFKKPD